MATVTTYKQLAQRIPTTTANMILYTVPTPTTGVGTTFVNTIIVCNTTGSSATYSLWVNQGGTAVADQFALMKNIPIAATASDQRIYEGNSGIILVGSTASIIIAASVGSALNFTIYGYEVVQS